MTFVLIGTASVDCSGIAQANVHLLGQRPYEQIPAYGHCFDVAIMPWRQNRWIDACNPVKLKEYLALGKPIVSTPFAELDHYDDLVYRAHTAQEFADMIRRAIAEDCPEKRARRRERVRTATWDRKAEAVMNELFS
jgi:glycosyltransferase involved in cell wall biosynthesis